RWVGTGGVAIGRNPPTVSGSLYIMSACCLMNQPFPAGNRGRGAAPSEQSESRGRGAAPEGARGAAPEGARAQGERGRGDQGRGGRGNGFGNVQGALAAAFSPHTKNPPEYFDKPLKDG